MIDLGAVKPCKKGFKGSMGVPPKYPIHKCGIYAKKGFKSAKKHQIFAKKIKFWVDFGRFWMIFGLLNYVIRAPKGQDESERYVPKCLAPQMRQNDHIFGSQGPQKPKSKIGEMSKSAVRQVA